MALNLSSAGIILLFCGRLRVRCIASNSHLVVQMPQPMHLFGSMFLLILIQEKKPSPGQKPPEKAYNKGFRGQMLTSEALVMFVQLECKCQES